jgi:outer membrane protein, multidrug efflux system
LTGLGGSLNGAIGTLLQASNSGYTFGAALLQTIFDGGKLVGQKHLAEATQKQYIAAYQSAVLNAYADVEYSLIAVANTGRSENHLRSQITAAQEAFEIPQLQYRQGAADLLNVLQAQQTLFRPKISWHRRYSPIVWPLSSCTRPWEVDGSRSQMSGLSLR